MATCKNCGNTFNDNFCSKCGHPAFVKRIDGHYILHEIEHIIHFERGLLYTIKELLIRPGKSINEFISENRNRLVKPVVFITITSLIYTIIAKLLHTEDYYINTQATVQTLQIKTYITTLFDWVRTHYGYANIMLGIFIAFWLKIFFRKSKYNFFEILIALCFIIGIEMLIFTLFSLIEGLFKLDLMTYSSLVIIVYGSWSIAQFFEGNWAIKLLKSFFSYFLGMLTYMIVLIIIGLVLDFTLGH